MERVAFLIEESGERVFAMMNPDELEFARQSGVRPRKFMDRPLAGANQTDDPLIQVGGGITDLTLNLLFDVDLHQRSTSSFSNRAAPSAPESLQAQTQANPQLRAAQTNITAEGGMSATSKIEDVRELSGPLWRLAENSQEGGVLGGPPVVHFIWGAAWFVRCVVLRVAERFEAFSVDGNPQRSWMRVHLRRVHMALKPLQHESQYTPPAQILPRVGGKKPMTQVHPITDPVSSSRPDLICDEIYGDSSLLHDLLSYNDVDDFWNLEPGFNLTAPPPDVLRGAK